MTELRDKIAIAAMNGLISSSGGISELKKATNILVAEGYPTEGVEVVAMISYELADAMLRFRNEGRVKRAKQPVTPRKITGNPSGTVVGGYG